MDTREKIRPSLEVARLFGNDRWAIVVGHFDPLTARQAARIAKIANQGYRILAIVIADADGLLEDEARAILVAALRGVSAVAVSNEAQWRPLIPAGADVEVFHDEQADRAETAEFVRLVIERQQSAVPCA